MKSRKGGGKKGYRGTEPLDPEDRESWDDFAKDITPLPARRAGRQAPAPPAGHARKKHSGSKTAPPAPSRTAAPPEIDRRTDERLRAGQMKVEARLDLHSMTQDEALVALEAFIRQSYERGRRCVLVITGTGVRSRGKTAERPWYEPPPGILHARVPQWLRGGRLGGMVLRFYPAQRRHGGDGALYVLIRRQRGT